MRKVVILFLILAIALPAAGQVRQKKTSANFGELLQQSQQAYDAEEYGSSIGLLRDAIALATSQQFDVILAAMPPAPPGFEKRPVDKEDLANPMAGAMAGGFGMSVEQKYRQQGGDGRISVTVTANSPMIAMVQAAFGMAAMDPDLEIVTYNEHRALFRKEDGGKEFELQLPVHGKHFVEIKAKGLDEDAFFQMFDQACIDKLAGAMGG